VIFVLSYNLGLLGFPNMNESIQHIFIEDLYVQLFNNVGFYSAMNTWHHAKVTAGSEYLRENIAIRGFPLGHHQKQIRKDIRNVRINDAKFPIIYLPIWHDPSFFCPEFIHLCHIWFLDNSYGYLRSLLYFIMSIEKHQ
jgi:hypothetical protein